MTEVQNVAGTELTDRHFEIIGLVAEGLTNDEISARIGVAVETVGSHLKNIYKRTGATNRAHLTSLAYRMGAITAPRFATAYRPLTKTEEDEIARRIYAAVMPSLAETRHWGELTSASRERCRSAARIAVQMRTEQIRKTAGEL